MSTLLSDLAVGIAVFSSTNIDDIFILAALFSDPRLHPRAVVAGQYLGIASLVLVSAVAARLALALPDGWIALLGVVPLLLGLNKLNDLRTNTAGRDGRGKEPRVQGLERDAERRLRSQILAVGSITIASGGDNIGVYVPLFAADPGATLTHSIAFGVLTGVWCALGYALVNNPVLGNLVRRYGVVCLPIVLIALGIYILSGALVLLR